MGNHGLHRLVGGAVALMLGLAVAASTRDSSARGTVVTSVPDVSVADGIQSPRLPQNTVDIREAALSGSLIKVPAGGNLQAAIDRAQAGDRIVLERGATYRGPFHLPRKDGQGWIVISTGERPFSLPGQRVAPADAAMMAKLVASRDSVIETDPGAHHFRFVGIEIAPTDDTYLRALLQLGAEEGTHDALPHHIIVDRCYLHGDAKRGTRRGVALNGRDLAVINSYLSDFKEVGADSQAIAGWNGPGPFRIANNYLEAAGENVMFGGADPAIDGLVPSDIEVVGNHMAKPLGWRIEDPHFQGTAWSVKNLFELKNARRVLVDGNLLEYNWPHAQNGFAILFTPRNQDGKSPWSVVEDVTFVNNLVRHVGAGVNVLGHDDIHSSQPTRRIAIRNNLFLDVGGTWGSGRLFQLLDGTTDITIDHNTAQQSDTLLAGGDRAPHVRFAFQNNIGFHNKYGVIGSGTGIGRPTFDRYFPDAVIRRNVIIGGVADRYPADNFFPASAEQVGFVDLQGHDLGLKASSAFKRAATDRQDVGANAEQVVATAGQTVRAQLSR